MADYTLSAKVTGDSVEFEKVFTNATKTVNKFQAKMEGLATKVKSVGDKISSAGKTMSVGITVPLAAAGTAAVNAASDFDENLNKVDVAFGKNAQSVKEWANTAITQFGLSKNQALQATSLFGDMATSMGINQKQATAMSISMAGLAGDLASFKNVGIDQAMTALNGVFTGETESLKQLGIVMTEVNLEEFAKKTGKVYSEMSQAEKVQLRYNYVMEMSKNAQGDYARTADGTANSLRTFQGSVENLSIAIGQNLTPVITPLVQKATEMVNAFASADPQLQSTIVKCAALVAGLGPLLVVIGKTTSGISPLISGIGKLGAKITELGGMKAMLSAVFSSISAPVLIAVAAIAALTAAFVYLFTTNEQFRNSMVSTVNTIISSLQPVIMSLIPVITNLATLVGVTLMTILQTLAPLIVQIASFIGHVVAQLSPLITQLVSMIVPVINTIIQVVTQVIVAIMPALIAILGSVMDAINALMPPIKLILSTVIAVMSQIMSAISPIIAFIANIITQVMNKITPIISFVSGVIASVISVIKPISSTVSSVFNSVFNTVSKIMSKVSSKVTGVFNAIKTAWKGLTGFVSGVFDGIGSAVDSLVRGVKGTINSVIGGINGAIGVINLIPGVNIGKIPKLAHGTDNWQGGFAYMNEGGRGELTYLPNGAQVIPHDISVKYAKESARMNTQQGYMDTDALGDYISRSSAIYAKQIADKLENGISKMKMVSNNRETARFMADLGFVKG